MIKIKRVLFILGVTAAVASGFAGYLRYSEILTTCAILFLLAIVFIILKLKFSSLKWFAAVCVCAAIFLALGYGFKARNIAPTERLNGNTATVRGYLYQNTNYNGGYQTLFIKTESVSLQGAPQEFKLSLSTPVSDTFEAGDYITAEVEFENVGAAYKNSYYADGIYINAKSYNVTHCESPQKITLRVLGAKISGVIKNKISILFPKDTIGLLNGLLIGDTSMMSEQSHANFIGSGMIHLVNVSGLHLSIIAGTIYKLFKKLNKGAATAISATAVVIIIAVTGFSESTLRAGIMFFIMLLAGVFSRKSDPLNSLGLAMLIMLRFNPMLYASGSFLLTCASVAGIVLFQRPISSYVAAVFKTMLKPFSKKVSRSIFNKPARYTVRIVRKCWDTAAVSIAANIAVTPILLILYGKLSLLSPFANLLTVTIVMYMLIAILITLGLSFVPILSVLTKPLAFLISIVCRYTHWVAELFGSTKVSSVSFGIDTCLNLVVFILITWGAVLMVQSVRGVRTATVILVCILVPLAGVFTVSLKPEHDCKILIPDVGKGYCAAVVYRDSAVIIGTGDDYSDGYIIESELTRQSVKTVKAIVVPNAENAAGSAKRLAKTYACEVYTESTDEMLSQKGISDLNISLGEINISSLKGDSGFAVLAKAYGKNFLFEAYQIGEIKSNTNYNFLICSAGAAASPNLPSAKNTVILGDNTPLIQNNPNNGKFYVLNGNAFINIPKSGEPKVLTNRVSSYEY